MIKIVNFRKNKLNYLTMLPLTNSGSVNYTKEDDR